MNLPQITEDYWYNTLLDPDGVTAITGNLRVLENLLIGHLRNSVYNHTSDGIRMDNNETLYTSILNLKGILTEYDGIAAAIANKALTMKNELTELKQKLESMKTSTINGKTGNILLKGMDNIVIGTAPASNTIIINNTQEAKA